MALVAACADEPFLSVALKRNLQPRDESVLVADGDVAPARVDRLLSLYRPRLDDAGVLHDDPAEGVRFEFWVRQGAEVRVPAPNALTRRRFVTAEMLPATTERYGRPGEGVHTLQVEINRALYLDEGNRTPHEGFDGLKTDLAGLFETLARALKDGRL